MIANIFRSFSRYNGLSNTIKRNIHLTTHKNCEITGKTTATILNREADIGLMIDAYSEVGFRLNNDFTVLGPMLIFPRSVLSWNIGEASDITEESLSLFTILEPKIDVLIIGIGDEMDKLPKSFNILKFMKNHNLSVEIMPTSKACPTFNFLNYDGRYAAAALIPPSKIEATDDDVLRTKLRYQKLYDQEVPLY